MAPKTSGKAVKKAGKAQKNISKDDKKKRKVWQHWTIADAKFFWAVFFSRFTSD
jgi:hypothetical protein